MLDLQPDDKVSIGQKLNHMMNEQAAAGAVGTISEKYTKIGKMKMSRLMAISIGVLVFFVLLCLFIIFMGVIY